METVSKKSLVIGILSVAYGAGLCLFWSWALGMGEGELPVAWTAGEVVAAVLFASVPVLLVVAGAALCWARAPARLRTVTTAAAAVLLAAQAALACRWAFDQGRNLSDLLDVVVGIWAPLACLAFVAVPSAAWSLVLAGTASLVGGGPPDAAGVGTGDGGRGQARPSWLRKRGVLCSVLVLPLAGLLGGLVLSHDTGPGAHDMFGLEGIWRDPVNPRHSQHFKPDGKLKSAWSGLSHGVIGTWSRHGQHIKIRHNRDWQHVDDLEGTLQSGTIQWQVIDRQTGKRNGQVVWKRD